MMRQCDFLFGGLCRAAFVSTICSCMATTLWAASDIIEPAAGYRADDIHTSITVRSQDISGNLLAIYDGSAGLQIFNRATDEHYNIGASGVGGDSWNSFVTFNPSGNSIWVGYDYNIYEVTDILGTPSWNHRATLWCNFDLAFSGNTPYVSGLNSESYLDPNAIWRLDTSDNNNHTNVAAVGGSSAGIAFDAQGNLYYSTSLGSDEKLVRFSGEQVTVGGLTMANAETLTDIPFSAYDTEVDDAGHVLFDFNDGDWNTGDWDQRSNTLAVWNGTVGAGDNYDVIGTAGAGHWFSYISVDGNPINGDGVVYLNDGAYHVPCPGLAEIRPVPEPASIVLIASGALAWLLRRRRKS